MLSYCFYAFIYLMTVLLLEVDPRIVFLFVSSCHMVGNLYGLSSKLGEDFTFLDEGRGLRECMSTPCDMKTDQTNLLQRGVALSHTTPEIHGQPQSFHVKHDICVGVSLARGRARVFTTFPFLYPFLC